MLIPKSWLDFIEKNSEEIQECFSTGDLTRLAVLLKVDTTANYELYYALVALGVKEGAFKIRWTIDDRDETMVFVHTEVYLVDKNQWFGATTTQLGRISPKSEKLNDILNSILEYCRNYEIGGIRLLYNCLTLDNFYLKKITWIKLSQKGPDGNWLPETKFTKLYPVNFT